MLNQKKGKEVLSACFSRLKSIISPPLPLLILLVIISIGALTYVFALGKERTPIAYVSYLISAYTLTSLCFEARFAKKYIDRAREIELVKDKEKRRNVILKGSVIFNGTYIALKSFVGIFYHVHWLVALAIYYLLIFLMRAILLFSKKNTKKISLFIGLFIILMVIPLIIISKNLVENSFSFSYPGYLIYLFALYSFILISTSIYNFLKDFKTENNILKSYRTLSLSLSAISILTLQSAMFSSFGDGNIEFERLMHTIVAAFVVAITLSLGIYLTMYSKKQKTRSFPLQLPKSDQ